jgi:hypothetical protein
LGLEVTIAIAAVTTPDDYIVTVSDRMISYGDVTLTEDNATMKAQGISKHWGVMFSATDARIFQPIVRNTILRMNDLPAKISLAVAKQQVTEAYQETFDAEFTSCFLTRLGIRSVGEFRKDGFAQLGPDVFMDLYRELSKFDLGIQLLCYGHDERDVPHLFEVENPGHAVSHDLLRYAVIGSGYWMASASLRRKHLSGDLEATIYRLLEAKFSAETATGVGKSTSVITLNSNGALGMMTSGDIDRIKNVWERALKSPEPEDAIGLIGKSNAVTAIAGAGR